VARQRKGHASAFHREESRQRLFYTANARSFPYLLLHNLNLVLLLLFEKAISMISCLGAGVVEETKVEKS